MLANPVTSFSACFITCKCLIHNDAYYVFTRMLSACAPLQPAARLLALCAALSVCEGHCPQCRRRRCQRLMHRLSIGSGHWLHSLRQPASSTSRQCWLWRCRGASRPLSSWPVTPLDPARHHRWWHPLASSFSRMHSKLAQIICGHCATRTGSLRSEPQTSTAAPGDTAAVTLEVPTSRPLALGPHAGSLHAMWHESWPSQADQNLDIVTGPVDLSRRPPGSRFKCPPPSVIDMVAHIMPLPLSLAPALAPPPARAVSQLAYVRSVCSYLRVCCVVLSSKYPLLDIRFPATAKTLKSQAARIQGQLRSHFSLHYTSDIHHCNLPIACFYTYCILVTFTWLLDVR